MHGATEGLFRWQELHPLEPLFGLTWSVDGLARCHSPGFEPRLPERGAAAPAVPMSHTRHVLRPQEEGQAEVAVTQGVDLR